ncbi:MAG TPA: hypothetical protein VFK09_06185 [Gemmatimonadales bacterium]|jgi:hypothetical protein|nr:hypothetical protein [Gemmatimonadales bacterium]
MTRTLAAAALVLALGACRDYRYYPKLSSEKGLVPADQWAMYGREEAQAVAIGREFAQAKQGSSPADFAKQTAAAAAYARTMPDVRDVKADTLGHWLTVTFKSGWRLGIDPIDDGKRGAETPNLPPGAGAPARR